IVVIAAGIAIRLVAGPQAVAQAPQQPAANAGPTRSAPPIPAARQAMPTAAPGNQPGTAPRQAPALSGVQPAGAMTKSAPPPSSTLQVMAVVNGEQITRTDLGRECIRRYGEEVLESMVNRQLIADACAQKGIQVTDADVSVEIDKVAGRFGLSRDRWLTLIREERSLNEEQSR